MSIVFKIEFKTDLKLYFVYYNAKNNILSLKILFVGYRRFLQYVQYVQYELYEPILNRLILFYFSLHIIFTHKNLFGF